MNFKSLGASLGGASVLSSAHQAACRAGWPLRQTRYVNISQSGLVTYLQVIPSPRRRMAFRVGWVGAGLDFLAIPKSVAVGIDAGRVGKILVNLLVVA